MQVSKMSFVTILVLLCASLGFSQTVIPIEDTAGEGADLKAALSFANSGQDVIIELTTNGGKYYLSEPDSITVPLTIRAAEGLTEKPVLRVPNGDTLQVFCMAKSDFTLQGIIMDGQRDDGTYDQLASHIWIDVTDDGSKPDYWINDCVFMNVHESGEPWGDVTGSAIETRNGATAGTIRIENSIFLNNTDEPILMQQVNKTPESVDSVIIRNCTFYNSGDNTKNQGQFTIKSDAGADIPHPNVLLENLTFYNSGTSFAIRDCPGTIVRNIIVANVNNNSAEGNLGSIGNTGSVISHVDTFMVSGCTFQLDDYKIPGDVPGVLDSATVYNLDPMFKDAENGDFTVMNPDLYNKAHDGGLLGDRRWFDESVSAVIDQSPISDLPSEFSLAQNYPNPFNPVTTIEFTLGKTSDISIKVYSLTGKLVETLYNGSKSAGQHSITWDASHLSSGVYFYKLVSGSHVMTRKMMLIK